MGEGTDERAVTDLDGNYTITTGKDAPVLVFYYMGFAPKEVAASQESMVFWLSHLFTF